MKYMNADGTAIYAERDDGTGVFLEPIEGPMGDLYRLTNGGALGKIAAYDPPPVPTEAELLERSRVQMPPLSFAQLLIGLVAEAWITEAEGEAWLSGTLPAAVVAVIASLPEADRFAARAKAARPSQVVRADPLVVALGVAATKSPEQLDTFFSTYRTV